jgi:hypothetical protein
MTPAPLAIYCTWPRFGAHPHVLDLTHSGAALRPLPIEDPPPRPHPSPAHLVCGQQGMSQLASPVGCSRGRNLTAFEPRATRTLQQARALCRVFAAPIAALPHRPGLSHLACAHVLRISRLPARLPLHRSSLNTQGTRTAALTPRTQPARPRSRVPAAGHMGVTIAKVVPCRPCSAGHECSRVVPTIAPRPPPRAFDRRLTAPTDARNCSRRHSPPATTTSQPLNVGTCSQLIHD